MEKHAVRYMTYAGDADSNTFKGILDVNPYGAKNEFAEYEEGVIYGSGIAD